MPSKLNAGDRFPSLTIDFVGGGELSIPEGMEAKYKVVLFYRDHWCPFCRRQLVGYEERKFEFDKLDTQILTASIDTGENSQLVQDEVSFSIGEGVSRETADALGSWWKDRRSIIQPSEFLLGMDNAILYSSYSSGSIVRTLAEDM